jgi:hypothetical protein
MDKIGFPFKTTKYGYNIFENDIDIWHIVFIQCDSTLHIDLKNAKGCDITCKTQSILRFFLLYILGPHWVKGTMFINIVVML